MGRLSRRTYIAARHTLGPALRLLFRPRYRGREHIPARGPVIIAANHLSHIDPALIMAAVDRPVHYLAKQEHFDGALRRALFSRLGVVPVDRRAGTAALAKVEAILRRGGVVGIFPEGTRSRDGHRGRGRTGVARLAAATGAAVVPVAIRGTQRLMPVGQPWPRLWHRVDYEFGAPFFFPPESPVDRASLRRFTDDLMARIDELEGHNRHYRRSRRLRTRAAGWRQRQGARLHSLDGRQRFATWRDRQAVRYRRNLERNLQTRRRLRENLARRRAALRSRLGR